MADFRIWGRIEPFGPDTYFVIVSAIPDPPVAGTGRFRVDSRILATAAAAETALDEMMRSMSDLIMARGHRIVDVGEDP